MKNNKRINKMIAILIGYFVLALVGIGLLLPLIQEALSDVFRYNPELILLSFFGCLLLVVFIPVYAIALFSRMDTKKNTKKDSEYFSNNDGARDYLEFQLHELNDKLSSTDERWKETYHLLLETQNRFKEKQNESISASGFLSSFGIDVNKITINPKQVFVITPFNSMCLEAYEVIKETCESLKMQATRSDEEYVTSNLMKHIVEMIVTSRIIVANVDGSNPNVMYELGIAHALSKPTIIIDKGNQLRPFDIQGNQIVIYNSKDELERKLKEQLLNVISSMR